MANYFKIGLDAEVSAFDICQAHQQLEADYNHGGWLRERPSNRRRMEATSCQLSRMQYHAAHRWVDIYPDDYFLPDGNVNTERRDSEDSGDDAVREIYMRNVLKWGLPIGDDEKVFIKHYFTEDFCKQYPQLTA